VYYYISVFFFFSESKHILYARNIVDSIACEGEKKKK